MFHYLDHNKNLPSDNTEKLDCIPSFSGGSIPKDGLVCHVDFSKGFTDLTGNVTFTTTGSPTVTDNYATLNDSNYLQGDKTILSGNVDKTFVCVVNLSTGSQLFEQGSQSTRQFWSMGYGRSSGYLCWHGWSFDYSSWAQCSTGKHVVAVTYSNSELKCYVDGTQVGSTLSGEQNIGTSYKLRLGRYNGDDWYLSGDIGFKLFAAYSRVLEDKELLKFKI